ncbi:MAG: CDP-diacylglycerol--glycerol-3-phosphate 3-phosphatidyltransferase [Desulfomicrobium sp.]|jgi:CDP-diacylglycerol--glycerol-3-phosphate 3-phosphatidyltransferase|nr:CDP-diacylglycerol--glycerol-3-phosphate 3-phosphatidyltransferase [Pseudomonadota bacterium]MBV1713198.1 CDP-diacylglycerol--glycerol-3-phosphate 3-phosphatidyltransferase [Desulfomicrobium sp.]MBU4571302.1 CDP-diacylglycerol--glycerol-3-phosphate 3-phosphatidyltransferase [Pseudomonadota bacterium]MBU4595564.1 CDP-diacylglycerol--glycerol-3-phosphate 3-phosphatidyltransferase [Pseudomonadota bacterium]MBV1720006.1 CDP-diacylglycerol--glycerol-3-phosphate 3-phosphatidyltransferase [Desulfom
MKINVPNALTVFRIMAAPFIVALLYFPSRTTCLLATIFFIVAILTDLADGFWARKYNQVTNFGKFLDPLADKVLIASVMIMLTALNWIPAWIAIIVIVRELLVTGLRAIAADKGQVIAADNYGKMKTIMQSVAMIPLIYHYPLFGIDVAQVGFLLLLVAVALTLYSGWNYLYSFYRIWAD